MNNYLGRANLTIAPVTAMQPSMSSNIRRMDEPVIVDTTAIIARPILSMKTSLTTRQTVNPLSVAR